jgi:hypothetical protein
VVSAADPLRSLISVFYTGFATFPSKYLLIYPHEAEWTPFQAHCYTENLVAPGNEPETSGLAASYHETTEAVDITMTQNENFKTVLILL